MKKVNLTLEELTKAFDSFRKENPNTFKEPKNYKWIAEDGTHCSMWDYGMLKTGDGGHEMIEKEIRKQCQKYL
jgi:hypothetical protein